jgi:multiple sugar transport system substrate-binding protein
VNGNYNEIPSGSKHPKQAFEFIAWMSGYDNAAWAAKAYPVGGWVPNSPQITKQPAYQKFLNQEPLRREFVNVMLNPHNEITPATPVDQLFDTTLGNDVTAVLEGKKTPIQALQDVQTVSNNALATAH